MWQNRWKKPKEDIFSAHSGFHFGYYIVGAAADIVSYFRALKATMALKRGFTVERWSNGLSVMLE